MMRKTYILLLALLVSTGPLISQKKNQGETLRVSMQKRTGLDGETDVFKIENEIQQWQINQTAIIICDMWDWHWCKESESRVTEMAPYMNEVVNLARDKGIFIVHAPSDVMEFYEGHPGRKMAMKYKKGKANALVNREVLPAEKKAQWPIDQTDGGCDCGTDCKQEYLWKRQIETIDIKDGDAISDSGVEIGNMFYKKGIKNVILMGVHTNMCVIDRTFGLRNMVRLGMNVVLMRDLTDTMYNPAQWPQVNHFTGNSLITEYIEKYVCPSIVSTDLTAKKQFRFKEDDRPIVAFVVAESEYGSNISLPEFAHDLLLTGNVQCEFAIGKPIMKGEGRHNIENIQIMDDADLMVLYARRRALPPDQMDAIKNFVKNGGPVLAMRTASHAFDAKGPISEGGVELGQWPEMDNEVLGGNYQGHHKELEAGTKVTVVPGMQGHSLLKGVDEPSFISMGSLYLNTPLASDNAQVLLLGEIPDEQVEPVFWINKGPYGNKVISTSLGHLEDWKVSAFHKIMMNSVGYLLQD